MFVSALEVLDETLSSYSSFEGKLPIVHYTERFSKLRLTDQLKLKFITKFQESTVTYNH